MHKAIITSLLLLTLVAPVHAQRGWRYWPGRYRPPFPGDVQGPVADQVPNLNGIWYLAGNPQAVCEIRQNWPDTRAEFINEQGWRALGSINGNRVWVPTWGQGNRGLEGVIVGDRIVWLQGNFWSRAAFPDRAFRFR
jgi:hypothetical protein